MVLKSVILVIVVGAVWPQAVESLSCYSCSGDECVNGVDLGVRVDCNSVQDACYTKFDGYVPTERGCVSALTTANPCTAGSCDQCTSDYCNVLGATSHKCVICSSVLDETCTSNPGGLQAQQCGAPSMDVAETQCYSRVIGSVTERGCVQSQTDLDTCDGTQCSTCTGEGCNNGEYPAGRQKCVKCSSTDCNTYAVSSYCDLPDDSCVTAVRTDGTYLKTCEQSMTEADRLFCQSNPSACSFCGRNECNQDEINLADTGRQCYTCQGNDCLASSLMVETCHEIDDLCFTIFDGFNPAQRGCRSALTTQDKAVCDDVDNVGCDLCEDDRCNVGGRPDHQCVYCSSTLDGNCVNQAAMTPTIQCPAPTTEVTEEALCYTRIIGKVTERGCLGSATDADQCDPEENCATCAGVGCNTAVFPADRRKCVVGAQADQYCPDPWDDCVQIASSTSGGANVKKCESSMSAEEVSFCKANSNKCDFCESDNCNQDEVEFNYLECMYCNSQDNSACATNPSTVTDLTFCTTCVSLLANNSQGAQILQRDCLEELSPEDAEQCTYHNSTTSDVTCTTCSTNRCNTGSYPEDRLACYSCEGGACFSHDTIMMEYCPNYQQGDSCFVQMDSAGMLTRMGCRSSLSASEQTACSANAGLCRTCDSAGCNDPMMYGNSGSCVQCDSVLDVGCVGRASSMDAEPCNDPMNTHCYTRLVGGSTIVRGCLSDLNTTELTKCNNGEDCSTCDSTVRKCNVDVYPADRLECYTCLQPPCLSHDTISLDVCPQYSTTDRCVMLLDASGAPIRLGCNSTLTTTEQSTCRTNPQLCRYGSTSRSNDPSTLVGSGKCVQCSSSNEPDCMNNPAAFEGTPCNDPLNSQCFSRLVNGNTTERGCLTDLDATSQTQCLLRNNCILCTARTERCNSGQYPLDLIRCHQCDSTQSATCKAAQSGAATVCPSYNPENHCYIKVQANGDTVRKCSVQPRETECSGSDRCEICRFSSCNSRVSTAVMATNLPAPPSTTTASPRPAGAPPAVGANLPVAIAMTVIALVVERRHLTGVL